MLSWQLQKFSSLIYKMFIFTCIQIVAFGRRGLRSVWDKVMFHGVIKKKGRVPSSDSFLVKRISGPGLHNDFVYQVFKYIIRFRNFSEI